MPRLVHLMAMFTLKPNFPASIDFSLVSSLSCSSTYLAFAGKGIAQRDSEWTTTDEWWTRERHYPADMSETRAPSDIAWGN